MCCVGWLVGTTVGGFSGIIQSLFQCFIYAALKSSPFQSICKRLVWVQSLNLPSHLSRTRRQELLSSILLFTPVLDKIKLVKRSVQLQSYAAMDSKRQIYSILSCYFIFWVRWELWKWRHRFRAKILDPIWKHRVFQHVGSAPPSKYYFSCLFSRGFTQNRAKDTLQLRNMKPKTQKLEQTWPPNKSPRSAERGIVFKIAYGVTIQSHGMSKSNDCN